MKKLLRAAQKSIMVWDPQGPARKPPKDSVNLILSVVKLFGISDTFRLCSEPDYLLRTIGGTSRGYIERSASWLIPIISSHSETINRLPSSASCFLLLRAYGTEFRGKNDQLLDLSAPLLGHVSNCLEGKFGEVDALHAADLLLIDAADQSPDRRHCARKVLQEAIGEDGLSESNTFAFDDNDFSWIFNLLHLEHTTTIIPKAIQHLTHALVYESGRVLRALVLGLHKYMEFVSEKNVSDSGDFDSLLVELISVRPHICSSVMDHFDDFRDIALHTVRSGFEKCISNKIAQDAGKSIRLKLCKLPHSDADSKNEAILPAPLLYAAIVVLSNWQGTESSLEPKSDLLALAHYLIIPHNADNGNVEVLGAAGAVFSHNGRRAVQAEHVRWLDVHSLYESFCLLFLPVTFNFYFNTSHSGQ